MTLPASGILTHQNIEDEFGGTHPIGMDEYYGRDTGIPSSGTIKMSDFHGAENIAQPPSNMLVPTSGYTVNDFTVSWDASSTPGATYLVESATDSTFATGVVTQYTGGDLSFSDIQSTADVYYYRVKAQASGYTDSPWSNYDSINVSVPTCGPPTNANVSSASESSQKDASWTASSTSGVTYHWSGGQGSSGTTSGTSANWSVLSTGNYTFSVYASKSGYNDSGSATDGYSYIIESCFTSDTLTRLLSGSLIQVGKVQIGDVLLGEFGLGNTVIGIDKTRVNGRNIWQLTGTSVRFTPEHPFRLANGAWGSFDKAALDLEMKNLYDGEPQFIETAIGTQRVVRDLRNYNADSVSQIYSGDLGTLCSGEATPLHAVQTNDKEEFVYTFYMSGDRTWNVEDRVVSGMAMGENLKLLPKKVN